MEKLTGFKSTLLAEVNPMTRKIFLTLLCIVFMMSAFAQRKSVDVGIFTGTNVIWGDLTKTDYAKSLGISVSAFCRYNLNSRLAIKTNIGYHKANIAGKLNSIETENVSDWIGNKTILDFSVQFQFNYLNFILGDEQHNFTPYIALGIGTNYYQYNGFEQVSIPVAVTPSGINYQYDLQPRPNRGTGYSTDLIIPFSVGVMHNIGKKLAVGLEWNLQKTLTDKLDNIADPFAIDANDNLHNNDWFTSFGVQINYLLFLNKNDCPVYDY